MTKTRSRTPGRLAGLLAVNAALLLMLGFVTFNPTAEAQGRVRGEYLMVGGKAAGLNAAAVWVVDTVNQELIVVTYDPNAKKVEGVGYRNLAADAQSVLMSGRPR
jgi:hypothetical protein